MIPRLLVAAGLLIAVPGCASLRPYAGQERLAKPVQLTTLRGFEIGKPDIVLRPDGPSMHSRLCRKATNYSLSPRYLEVAALGVDGQSLWKKRYKAPHLGTRPAVRCKYFDLPVDEASARAAFYFSLALKR